jgi:transposase-like protein
MPRPTKSKHLTNPLPVKAGRSTGMAIPEAKAEAIAAAHLAGMSIRQICKAMGTCHNSVVSVIRNRPELLERAREVTAANWRTIAAISTAQLLERLEDLKDSQLGIVAGIASDKALLLSGEPTQRVEVSIAPAADQWASFVAGLRDQQEAEVIDVAFQPVELAAPAI